VGMEVNDEDIVESRVVNFQEI